MRTDLVNRANSRNGLSVLSGIHTSPGLPGFPLERVTLHPRKLYAVLFWAETGLGPEPRTRRRYPGFLTLSHTLVVEQVFTEDLLRVGPCWARLDAEEGASPGGRIGWSGSHIRCQKSVLRDVGRGEVLFSGERGLGRFPEWSLEGHGHLAGQS